jgi:signal transduction histidine kinase
MADLHSYLNLAEAEAPVSAPGPEHRVPEASPADLLERSLNELVRYYRHSGAGRLVAGLVHRMNTPLQVLSFQLELLEQKSREEPEVLAGCPAPAAERLAWLHDYRREKIRQFRGEIDKLQALVHRLLLQGIHEAEQDRQPLDLNQIIEAELELYQAQPFFQHQVQKNIRLQSGLPPIYGHYLDFSQSFRNLLDNALEAMAQAPRRELTVVTALKEGRRVLAVSDTGPGFPPEVRTRLFQPFCTTKQGHAGLGLCLVRRLLVPYGAAIRVDSTPGATRVKVYLPL